MLDRVFIILSLFIAAVFTANATDYTFSKEKGVVFAWTVNDATCANAASGAKIIERVQNVESTKNYAQLNNVAWSLSKNYDYKIYYPYNSIYTTNSNPITALPVSYKAQKQMANNSLKHLSPYDYMVAHCTTTESTADFEFEHFGGIVCIEWKAKAKMTVTEVSLSTEEELFVTDAEMNLTTKTLNTITTANSMTLELDNVEIGEGECLNAYMMLAPANLNAMDVILTITTSEGDKYKKHFKGATILPGMCYPIVVDGADSGVEHIAEAKVMPQQTSTTSTLQSPRAYAPDFLIDTENTFEPVTPSGISSTTFANAQSQPVFTTDGKKTNGNKPNEIQISKGKKYIKR